MDAKCESHRKVVSLEMETPAVGSEHYIEEFMRQIAIAKHEGRRVILDVYEAEQLLEVLHPAYLPLPQ